MVSPLTEMLATVAHTDRLREAEHSRRTRQASPERPVATGRRWPSWRWPWTARSLRGTAAP